MKNAAQAQQGYEDQTFPLEKNNEHIRTGEYGRGNKQLRKKRHFLVKTKVEWSGEPSTARFLNIQIKSNDYEERTDRNEACRNQWKHKRSNQEAKKMQK